MSPWEVTANSDAYKACSVAFDLAILVYPRDSHIFGSDPSNDNHAIHTEPQPRFS